MKIYTKKGDKGSTTLYREKEVPKDDPRIELIGQLDELNSHLGFANSLIKQATQEVWRVPYYKDILNIQKDLFEIGAVLAGAKPREDWLKRVTADIESKIDEIESTNKPLTNFILPGGTPSASALHVARSVCRRVERTFVEYHSQIQALLLFGSQEDKDTEPDLMSYYLFYLDIIAYLNRLGDYLFVVARKDNASVGDAEILWIRE